MATATLFERRIKPLLRPLVRRLRESRHIPFILSFATNGHGREYGVGWQKKWALARRILTNAYHVRSGSNWKQHLRLIDEILRIPRNIPGDVVECGCYHGASSASLSLACALVNRRLFICDSFQGLPEPEEEERYEIYAHDMDFYYVWEKGEFKSPEGVEGVRRVVENLGDLSVCRFVPGYFNESLPHIGTDQIVMVFEDADLASSVRDCLISLWPRLQEGCRFFCHEPWSIHVVGIFYDQAWWRDHLHAGPPGFHGSGEGVPFFPRWPGRQPSFMGYAEKFDPERIRDQGGKIIHHGSIGFQENEAGRFDGGRWRK